MPRWKPSRAAGLAAEVGMAKTSQARNKNRKKGVGNPTVLPPEPSAQPWRIRQGTADPSVCPGSHPKNSTSLTQSS